MNVVNLGELSMMSFLLESLLPEGSLSARFLTREVAPTLPHPSSEFDRHRKYAVSHIFEGIFFL